MQTDNTFTGGLNLDANPIAVTNNLLVNCLNGTIITCNGNESILQNDLGNCKVEYAYLPSGYVPVGMKEYGGVIYVASVKPDEGKCLIGSFPSPERIYGDSNDNEMDGIDVSLSDFLVRDNSLSILKTTKIVKDLSVDVGIGSEFWFTKNNNQKITTWPNIIDTCILVNIGIKNSDNSITIIEDSPEDGIFHSKYSGKLCLVALLMDIPEDFSVSFKYDKKDTDGYHIIKIDTIPTVYTELDWEFTPSEDNSLSTDEETGDTIIKAKGTFNYEVTPYIKLNNMLIKVPQLTLKGVYDINDNDLTEPSLNTWKYSYNSEIVKLVYGFSYALNIKSVKFLFYPLMVSNGNYSFNSDPIEISATSRNLYTGQFRLNITGLASNWLYLVKISADNYKFYKWLWTNDLLNNSLNDFDNSKINLNVLADYKVTLKGKKPENDWNGILNNTKEINLEFEEIITYTQIYELNTVDSNVSVLEAEKIPFNINPPSVSYNSTVKILNTSNTQDSFTNNIYIPSQDYDAVVVENGVTLTSKYIFKASPHEVTKTRDTSYSIVNYLDSNRETVFGKTNDFVDLGISMGKYQADLAQERWHTHYKIKFRNGGDIDKYNHKVTSDTYDNDGTQRSWENQICPNIISWLNSELEFVPTILFLTNSVNFTDNELDASAGAAATAKTLLSYKDNNYGTYSDYGIVLWYDGLTYNFINTRFLDATAASNKIKDIFSKFYVCSNERGSVDLQTPYYTPALDRYGYTTDNTVNCDVEISIEYTLDLLSANSITTYLTNQIKDAVKNTTFISLNLKTSLQDSSNVQFTCTLKELQQKLHEIVSLELLDIYNLVVHPYLYNEDIYTVCFGTDTKDGNGNTLNRDTIYYLGKAKDKDKDALYPILQNPDLKQLAKILYIKNINNKQHILINKSKNLTSNLLNGYCIWSCPPCIGDNFDSGKSVDGYPFSMLYGYNSKRNAYDSNYRHFCTINIGDDKLLNV